MKQSQVTNPLELKMMLELEEVLMFVLREQSMLLETSLMSYMD